MKSNYNILTLTYLAVTTIPVLLFWEITLVNNQSAVCYLKGTINFSLSFQKEQADALKRFVDADGYN